MPATPPGCSPASSLRNDEERSVIYSFAHRIGARHVVLEQAVRDHETERPESVRIAASGLAEGPGSRGTEALFLLIPLAGAIFLAVYEWQAKATSPIRRVTSPGASGHNNRTATSDRGCGDPPSVSPAGPDVRARNRRVLARIAERRKTVWWPNAQDRQARRPLSTAACGIPYHFL